MTKAPRMPAQEVIARIRQQVTDGDRSPFADLLADALAVAPSKTALRSAARQNPRAYVSMLKELADLTGYASRTEHVSIRHDARSMALELVNRVGEDRARSILKDFNLPASLIPRQTASEPIDGEIVESDGTGPVSSGDASDDEQNTHSDTNST